MKKLLVGIVAAVVTISFIVLPVAAGPVVVVLNPKVSPARPDKDSKAIESWIRNALESELSKCKKLELREMNPAPGSKAKMANLMVVSSINIMGKGKGKGRSSIPGLGQLGSLAPLKAKKPCSISVNLRLVNVADSQIRGVSSANTGSARWPGWPEEDDKDIAQSEFGRLINPLIKKAVKDVTKSL